MMEVRQIAEMLGQRADTLARDLLPGGKRDGRHWRCGSIMGEPGQSFVLTLAGSHAGRWTDFAGGGAEGSHGDCLDLVALRLCQGNKAEAIKWARQWLGLAGQVDRAAMARAREDAERARAARDAAASAEVAESRSRAQGMFLHARERIGGTGAAAYLAGRGIDLAALGRQPRSLRFAPGLWNARAQAEMPAMVAAVTGETGHHIATHVTWLSPGPGGVWRKAAVQPAKQVFGSFRGGSIRLWRGASGRNLREAQPGEAVAIAEGIEDGLTIALTRPDLRVLAAISVNNLPHIALPQAIGTVLLVCQRDGENDGVRRARAAAAQRWLREGREVREAWPPEPHKDFNDWLQAERRREGAA